MERQEQYENKNTEQQDQEDQQRGPISGDPAKNPGTSSGRGDKEEIARASDQTGDAVGGHDAENTDHYHVTEDAQSGTDRDSTASDR